MLVESTCLGATEQQLQQAQLAAMRRGERVGGPPYRGCMLLAVTAGPDGPRFTAAWRTEQEFEAVFGEALRDLTSAGMTTGTPTVTPVLAMAIPGAHPS